jgi:hypothetical protein
MPLNHLTKKFIVVCPYIVDKLSQLTNTESAQQSLKIQENNQSYLCSSIRYIHHYYVDNYLIYKIT